MGHYMDRYCQGVEGVDAIYKAASEKIKLGAITIGEYHTKPYARAVVYDLIDAGFVKRLFIEFPDAAFVKTLRNDNLGKEVEQWPASGDQNVYNLGVGFLDRGRPNLLPMQALIQTAVSKSVKVYFYDLYHDDPTSSQGMQARNEAMAKVFLKHTETKTKSPIGAIALVGGKHLETPENDTIYTLSLQVACRIPHDHVFDLHRL